MPRMIPPIQLDETISSSVAEWRYFVHLSARLVDCSIKICQLLDTKWPKMMEERRLRGASHNCGVGRISDSLYTPCLTPVPTSLTPHLHEANLWLCLGVISAETRQAICRISWNCDSLTLHLHDFTPQPHFHTRFAEVSTPHLHKCSNRPEMSLRVDLMLMRHKSVTSLINL